MQREATLATPGATLQTVRSLTELVEGSREKAEELCRICRQLEEEVRCKEQTIKEQHAALLEMARHLPQPVTPRDHVAEVLFHDGPTVHVEMFDEEGPYSYAEFPVKNLDGLQCEPGDRFRYQVREDGTVILTQLPRWEPPPMTSEYWCERDKRIEDLVSNFPEGWVGEPWWSVNAEMIGRSPAPGPPNTTYPACHDRPLADLG